MSEPSEFENRHSKSKATRPVGPDGEPLSSHDEGDDELGVSEPVTETHRIPDDVAKANAAEVDQLRTDLEASRRRVDELARAFQALDKDREDFKQRLTRERERMIDVEKGNVATSLLEALDELDLCLTASEADTSPLAKGVRLVRDNLLRKLESTGISRMPLMGQLYDPNVAEAIDMELTVDPAADQTVIGEIRPAYRMKDRIVRPGKVKVAKYVKPADA